MFRTHKKTYAHPHIQRSTLSCADVYRSARMIMCTVELAGFSLFLSLQTEWNLKQMKCAREKKKIFIIKWNACSPVISNNSVRIRAIIAKCKYSESTKNEIHLTLGRKTFCYFHFTFSRLFHSRVKKKHIHVVGIFLAITNDNNTRWIDLYLCKAYSLLCIDAVEV